MKSSRLLLVRPSRFGYNAETSSSNAFQFKEEGREVASEAIMEFHRFTQTLSLHHIDYEVWEDSPNPVKPDAVFPNNWFSTHAGGTLVLYPMEAVNRRAERDPALIDLLKSRYGSTQVLDLTAYEMEGRFLEGTGSLVLDRERRLAFACLSSRTDEALVNEWCVSLNYSPIIFHARDAHGVPIYHTNVMMSIGPGYAVVALDAIENEDERNRVLEALSPLEIVPISLSQVEAYAGNIFSVISTHGTHCILMSSTARRSLTSDQIFALRKHGSLLPIPIPTIERIGGGSVRCMVAELCT